MLAVEAIGGASGAIDGNFGQIGVQAFGILVTIVWSGAASAVLLVAIDKVIGLRVDEDAEAEGLDLRIHGESVH